MSYDSASQPPHLAAAALGEDLTACLLHNPQRLFTVADIVQVPVEVRGAPGGRAWHWILELSDGRVLLLQGQCASSGWAQSSAWHVLLQRRGPARRDGLAGRFAALIRYFLPAPQPRAVDPLPPGMP